ncbi:MAG: molybdopterin-dependent oxidoreductase [Nitriliruptoraceae bacterium]
MSPQRTASLSHWGAYALRSDGARVTGVEPLLDDPDPSPLGAALAEPIPPRVLRPAVRRSWLQHGPGTAGAARGREPLVEVSWDRALDLVAAELDRVRTLYGNGAIFAGSYGWASAGRFHHAQSQLKRFLTLLGGFVASEGTYSHGAAEAVLPRVTGLDVKQVLRAADPLAEIAEHTERFVSFGGLPSANQQIVSGGGGRHHLRAGLRRAAERGCRFVSVSPVRTELDEQLRARWLPLRPGTDAAVLLGMLHHLVAEGAIDLDGWARRASGTELLRAHLSGEADGIVRGPAWAAARSGLPTTSIRALAEEVVQHRTMLNLTWSLQRTDRGEHALWAGLALATALGQWHLPGAGLGFGYGSMGSVGAPVCGPAAPALPAGGPNPISERIPVARIADALLTPGGRYLHDGQERSYPHLALVYWAGGNPFHHHQDLHRLERAWAAPETVIVHEPVWTATARRADIVLPTTLPAERRDLGGGSTDEVLVAMDPAVPPPGEARDDHAIFAGLAERLGVAARFTEGRDVDAWLSWLYERIRDQDPSLPTEAEFRRRGIIERRPVTTDRDRITAFLTDPQRAPLPTPSGRVELVIDPAAGPGLPAHPSWHPPAEWLGTAAPDELHLLSPQPRYQLHGQYDWSALVQQHRQNGRAVVEVHPRDAAERGLEDGDVVRLWNERGACYAALASTTRVRPGVAVLPTGAWWDPDPDTGVCRRGNPNALTRDVGTSTWGQATSAHTCLVRLERASDAPPPIPHGPPALEDDHAL